MNMATHPLQSYITVEEYFDLCRNNHDQHYEYIDGQVIMLAGGKLNHARIARNIIVALDILFPDGTCQAFTSDAIVRISPTRYVLPDVAVTCDELDHQNNDYIQFPCVLFEVLSPSTEAKDRGQKLNWYRACPTIKEYVLVNTREPLVELYRREKDPMWSYLTFEEKDEVPLTSLNITLPVHMIYRNIVTFGE
jgi:Uma2 family endonuclease